jgi:hypothetical protein
MRMFTAVQVATDVSSQVLISGTQTGLLTQTTTLTNPWAQSEAQLSRAAAVE